VGVHPPTPAGDGHPQRGAPVKFEEPEELDEIPRKCLGWRTPREAYDALLTSAVASTS
jgi:hypothetical protein